MNKKELPLGRLVVAIVKENDNTIYPKILYCDLEGNWFITTNKKIKRFYLTGIAKFKGLRSNHKVLSWKEIYDESQ